MDFFFLRAYIIEINPLHHQICEAIASTEQQILVPVALSAVRTTSIAFVLNICELITTVALFAVNLCFLVQIVATMMLRQVELDESVIPQTWPRVRQALKKELRALWSLLIEMRKFVGTSARDAAVPRWLGNGSISKEFFVTYVGSHYRNILHKIAFSGMF
jgi:hypothetical protein